MDHAFTCPSCGQRYRLKQPPSSGRAKCRKCGQVFELPAANVPPADRFGLPEAPSERPEMVAPEPPAIRPPSPRPARASAEPARPWTLREKAVLRFGLTLAAFGLAGLILPMFGLQLRKLSRLGDDASAVAGGILALGLVISGIVLIRHNLRLAFRIGGPVLAALFLLVAGVAYLGRPRQHGSLLPPPPPASAIPLSVAGTPPGRPPSPPEHRAIRSGPAAPVAPSRRDRPDSPGPEARKPAGPEPGNAAGRSISDLQYDSLVRQFGVEKVIRINLEGAEPRDIGKLQMQLRRLLPPTAQVRVNLHQGLHEAIVAPVDDLKTWSATLELGTVESVEPDQHSLTLKLDPSKLH
jgi:hypothetical protein